MQLDNLIFIGDARDYHAMDWYRVVNSISYPKKIPFLTDLIESEKRDKLITENDNIIMLYNIDKLLLPDQSNFGNIWRNFIKVLVSPLQIHRIKKISKNKPGLLFHAHTMYYMFLCWAAKVNFGGTPQAGEILGRPLRSKIYKYFAVKSLMAAKFVTVDSVNMKNKIFEMCGKEAIIVQYGIDTTAISHFLGAPTERNKIVSIRGFDPLYRLDEIFDARTRSRLKPPLILIYPLWEDNYKKKVLKKFKGDDLDLGRLTRNKMYELLTSTKLAISIPKSDSSPRGVYEAIFCGCCVAVTYNPYLDVFPACMRARLFIVDLNDDLWFEKALEHADLVTRAPYQPSDKALELFDQKKTIKKAADLLYRDN